MQNDLAVELHTVEQDFPNQSVDKRKKLQVLPCTHFSIPTLKNEPDNINC